MFPARYVPGFFVLSLGQRVHMNTTIWGNGTVSTIAISALRPVRKASTGSGPGGALRPGPLVGIWWGS
jgi:hypothetical protein